MRDKYKSLSIINGQESGDGLLPAIVSGCEWALASALEPLLDDVTAIMLRFRCLHLKRQFLGETIQRCECLLYFIGGKQVCHLRAACGYEEESAPKHQLKLFQQVRHVFQVMHVSFRNTGVDLNGKTKFVRPMNRFQRSGKRAGYAAESIMQFRSRAVKAYGHSGEMSAFQVGNSFAR